MAADHAGLAQLWARIKEHKVLQWGLAYLGAALAIAQCFDLLSDTYQWPPLAARIVLGLLIIGLPLVLVLAWYHGHQGLTKVSTGEMTVLSVMVLIGAGVFALLLRSPSERSDDAPRAASVMAPAEGRLRLAVMPLENLSPDPANAFFADGLHDEILSTLSQRIRSLDVISRTTMMTFRRDPKPVAEVASQLGASHVLEGSVRREGDRVRVTLQLIEAQSDRHVWSQSYDRNLASVISLQSDVAAEISAALFVRLEGAATPPTENPQAYELYLKVALTRGEFTPFSPLHELREFETLLTQVIALDPEFGVAYAHRGTVRILMFIFNHVTGEEHLNLVRADLAEARRLAPGNPQVLGAEAYYVTFIEPDNQKALAAFAAAEAAGLSDPPWLSAKIAVYGRMQRNDEAIALNERLLALDPANLLLYALQGQVYSDAGRGVEAVRALERGIQRFPNSSLVLLRSSTLYQFTGKSDDWNAVLMQIPPGADAASLLAQRASLLRAQRKFTELEDMLDALPFREERLALTSFWGAGNRPVAEYRGWAALYTGDESRARQAGLEIRRFLDRGVENDWNRTFRLMLAAESLLFLGEKEAAVAAAQRALVSVSRAEDSYAWWHVAGIVTRLYAWAGQDNLAMALIEEWQRGTPGPSPATLARDPGLAIPLADHAGYRALAERMEAQMRAMPL